MPKDHNIQFLKLVHEVFDSVIHDYGFMIHDADEGLVIAQKEGIDLIFRLESTRLFYHFSLEIKLSGELGEKAATDSSYRHLGVAAIAKCLDPNYKMSLKKSQTNDDLREVLEINKQELLKYCKQVLLGDTSFWPEVVDCLREESKKSGFNR